MKDTETISRRKYAYLLLRDELLTALERNGVDNWQGYDYAMEEYEKNAERMIKDEEITLDEYNNS